MYNGLAGGVLGVDFGPEFDIGIDGIIDGEGPGRFSCRLRMSCWR